MPWTELGREARTCPEAGSGVNPVVPSPLRSGSPRALRSGSPLQKRCHPERSEGPAVRLPSVSRLQQPALPGTHIAADDAPPPGRYAGQERFLRLKLLIALLALGAAPGTAAQQPGTAAPAPYIVLLDAAHGGPEPGARLADSLLEKNLTLALSVRLRSVLSAHGMGVATTREADTNPTPEARAALANRTHPAACLLLHATTSGTGVHLYTSALVPAAAPAPGTLRPWATAQAPFLTDSLKLSSDIREALTHSGIPIVLGSVSLQPVDSMACPAVIVEVAPLLARRGKPALALGTPEYETRLVDALDGALEQWRADRPPTQAAPAAPAVRAQP